MRRDRTSIGAPLGRLAAAAALLTAVALAIGVARADAATLSSAVFDPPTLTTKWMLDSGDCASSVSISDSPAVGAYGFFTGWHASWGVGNCLATSNSRTFNEQAGVYYVLGHPLHPAPYYVQLQYCHDSDSGSGNYYCRATNVLKVRIPGSRAGYLSDVQGGVLVNGRPARDAMIVHYGDEVRTGRGASATMNLSGGGELKLRESSRFIAESPGRAMIPSGRLKAYLDRSYRIVSPNAAGAVSGTVFSFAVRESSTRDRTYKGSVAFSNTKGTRRTVIVKRGYESIVRGSNPPTEPRRF